MVEEFTETLVSPTARKAIHMTCSTRTSPSAGNEESVAADNAAVKPHGGPVQSHHHIARVVSLRGIKEDVRRVEGFNAKLAVVLTRAVGTMATAYLFALISLTSLPAVITSTGWVPKSTFPHWLTSVGMIAVIAWIAQTFLQLVLLSVIMVGQAVQGATADARAANTYADAEYIKDQVNEHTDGGIKAILDRLDVLEKNV